MNLSSLPKVELHCHIDGLVTPSMLRSLAERGFVHSISIDALQAVWPVRSRAEWLDGYASLVNTKLFNNSALLLEILVEHATNLIAQNVFYSEIMLSSFTLEAPDVSAQTDLFRQFRAVADKFLAQGLQIEFLVALGRRKNLDVFRRQAERVIAAAEAGLVCGVAIAGDEHAVSVRELHPILQDFRAAGLEVEIHAGERGEANSVWDALEWGAADRIGHGLGVFEDPELLDHVRKEQIHLEMCPTSNVVLGGFSSYGSHPIRRAVREGLDVSVSTDDPGALGITLTSELERLQSDIGLTESELQSLQKAALASRFCRELKVEYQGK